MIDFAHLHAVTDGAFTGVEAFAGVLTAADTILEPGAPFHIHFSDIQYANRNETKHLPYGEGTLRAEPLAEALARFKRPATVISESPDEASSQTIRSILDAGRLASARPLASLRWTIAGACGRSRALPERSPSAARRSGRRKEGSRRGTMGSPTA